MKFEYIANKYFIVFKYIVVLIIFLFYYDPFNAFQVTSLLFNSFLSLLFLCSNFFTVEIIADLRTNKNVFFFFLFYFYLKILKEKIIFQNTKMIHILCQEFSTNFPCTFFYFIFCVGEKGLVGSVFFT